MFLKNKNIIFKIRISKVTDYAALNGFILDETIRVAREILYCFPGPDVINLFHAQLS